MRQGNKRGRRAVAIALAGLGLAALDVRAADTWTNTLGNGLWDQGGNWADMGIPGAGDAVTFPTPGPAGKSVLLPLAGTMQALSLTFDESYTLNSGRVDVGLSGPGGGMPISVAAGKTATINSALGGSGINKSGAGTLVLGGNNTTTLTSGDLKINAGTVRVSSDANLGALFKIWTTGVFEADGTFSSTKRFEPSSGIIRVTTGNTLSLTANDQFGFSSTDTLTKDGPGILKVTGHSSRFGTTFTSAGVLRLEGDTGYGPHTVNNGGTLEVAQTFGTLFNNVTLNTGSTLRGAGNQTASNVFGGAGDLTLTLASGPTSADGLTVQLKSTFGGTIASTINIVGPGTVTLNQATNYPGAWNVNSGTLRFATTSQALGSGTGVTVSVGVGILLLDNISTNRTINLGSGAILRGAGSLAAAVGPINVGSGQTNFVGTSTAGATLTLGSGLTGGASGTMVMHGAGTVVLQQPTTYAGAWWVTAGTLKLQHASSLGLGTSAVEVRNTGALEAVGVTITRDISLLDGGTLRGSGGGGGQFDGTIAVGNGASVSFAGNLALGDAPNDLTGGGPGTILHVVLGGGGAVSLTQPSDVAGIWSIDSGALQASDDAQLGAAANTLSLNGNGATFRTTGPITSTRDMSWNAGVFDTSIYDSTFGNVTGGAGNFLKVGDAALTVNRIRGVGLSVAAGTLRLKPDGSNDATSTFKALAVLSPGRFDLADNKLVVKNTPVGTWDGSAYTDLTGQIQSGRNGGAWSGSGIVTSQSLATASTLTSIGVATAAQVKSIAATETAVWGGQTVTGSDTLVMYTYGGDATLDGKIDVDDYGRIDFNAALGTSGWFNGDFNYDGKINVDDYGIIDFNIGIQGPPFSTGSGPAAVAAVPEPGLFPLLSLSLTAQAFTRRRRYRPV